MINLVTDKTKLQGRVPHWIPTIYQILLGLACDADQMSSKRDALCFSVCPLQCRFHSELITKALELCPSFRARGYKTDRVQNALLCFVRKLFVKETFFIIGQRFGVSTPLRHVSMHNVLGFRGAKYFFLHSVNFERVSRI